MFEQTFVEDTHSGKKPLSILASLTIQACILCLLIGAPLLYTRGLPGRVLKSLVLAPPAPRVVVHESPAPMSQTRFVPRLLDIRQFTRPVMPSRAGVPAQPAPPPDIGEAGSAGGEGSSDLLSGLVGSGSGPAAPPPAAAQSKTKPANGPLRVGSGIAESKLIHKVVPAYPFLAKATRVQGAVEFTAVIGKNGNIENLQLVRGHPLPVGAAKDAVLQWKYQPTLLNGVPVEVLTDIIVNFTLAQ